MTQAAKLSRKLIDIFALVGNSELEINKLASELTQLYPNNCVRWKRVITSRSIASPTDLLVSPAEFASLHSNLTAGKKLDFGVLVCSKGLNSNPTAILMVITDTEEFENLEKDINKQNVNGRGKFGEDVHVQLTRILFTDLTKLNHPTEPTQLTGLEINNSDLQNDEFWYKVIDTSKPINAQEFFVNIIWEVLMNDDPNLWELRAKALDHVHSIVRFMKRTSSLTKTLDILNVLSEAKFKILGIPKSAYEPQPLSEKAVEFEEPSIDNNSSENVELHVGKTLGTEDKPVFKGTLFGLNEIVKFSDWILTAGIGIKAFRTPTSFHNAFLEYISYGDVNPLGLDSEQLSIPGNLDADLVRFKATLDNYVYEVVFNFRIKQVISESVQ